VISAEAVHPRQHRDEEKEEAFLVALLHWIGAEIEFISVHMIQVSQLLFLAAPATTSIRVTR
jgi:hypothetical protein